MTNPAPVYDFSTQLNIGEGYEKTLDTYFSRFFRISIVPLQIQKLGVDRIFIYKGKPKRRFTVEYKADIKAAETHRIFVEIESNSTTGKPGWAYSSVAQQLVYYIPPWNRAAIVSMLTLREAVIEWERKYEKKLCRNSTYHSTGIVVPVQELKAIASRVITVESHQTP